MKKIHLLLALLMVTFSGLVFAQESKLNLTTHPSIIDLKSNFKNPGRDYATAPLWVWNDAGFGGPARRSGIRSPEAGAHDTVFVRRLVPLMADGSG